MKTINWYDKEGFEIQMSFPTTVEVCPRCGGRGVHDHPAFSNGFTTEDFDMDPDFREDYMRGNYDVRCSECDGRNVVEAVDVGALDDKQRDIWDSYCQDRAEKAAEQRMRDRGIQF